jgi:4-hydroxyacetophenone monooxygenase
MNIELSRKKLDLSSAIAEGDIRVLLMVLVHMTGDERWLEPPYKPKRDIRLIPDPQAGVPLEIQAEIRAAVLNQSQQWRTFSLSVIDPFCEVNTHGQPSRAR